MALGILRESVANYQNTVIKAKSQYLSYIISSSCHCPSHLFSTINAAVNFCTSVLTDVSHRT